MTAPKSGFEHVQNIARIERYIQERTQSLPAEDLPGFYEMLLQTIWGRILPILGQVTVLAILERAITLTAREHQEIRLVRIVNQQFDFSELHQEQERSATPPMQRCQAYHTLVAHLVRILTVLTGDVIIRQLLKALERQEAEEADDC